MKRFLSLCLLLTLFLSASSARAADLPLEKALETVYTHQSDTLQISIEQWHYVYKKHDLRFFVADILTASPAQLQTAFAGEAYSAGAAEATSAIAERHNAVLAINGDYYNYKDNHSPVIRNGVLYRDLRTTRDLLMVHRDGTFIGVPAGSYEAGSGPSCLEDGIVQSFTFGPLLVSDGVALTMPQKYIIKTSSDYREPRTAIGQIDPYHYVVIVADGRRSDWSDKGMTLDELAAEFVCRGCRIAYNLDGGGSTTLLLNGQRLNRTSGSRERDVSDIVYFID